jgi:hypothetical protein
LLLCAPRRENICHPHRNAVLVWTYLKKPVSAQSADPAIFLRELKKALNRLVVGVNIYISAVVKPGRNWQKTTVLSFIGTIICLFVKKTGF